MEKETFASGRSSSTSSAAGTAPPPPPGGDNGMLIELVGQSSPNRPHHRFPSHPRSSARRRSWMSDAATSSCIDCGRRFTLFSRRHHCRRCGGIFCNGCSNNRVTNLRGTDDKDYFRLCNSCIDELLENEVAVLVPNERCGLAQPFRKFAAIIVHAENDDGGEGGGEDVDLLRFDEQLTIGPTPFQMHSMAPMPFTPLVPLSSTPSNDGVLSRLASAAFSLPARLRNSQRPLLTPEAGGALDYCPVCSTTLRKWHPEHIQKHIEDCINMAETGGSLVGDRFSVHRWRESMSAKECVICYEEFSPGQMIAVLNCLCQFHQECIERWFARGKHCPFHSGD